jgi:hypothetical protein
LKIKKALSKHKAYFPIKLIDSGNILLLFFLVNPTKGPALLFFFWPELPRIFLFLLHLEYFVNLDSIFLDFLDPFYFKASSLLYQNKPA